MLSPSHPTRELTGGRKFSTAAVAIAITTAVAVVAKPGTPVSVPGSGRVRSALFQFSVA